MHKTRTGQTLGRGRPPNPMHLPTPLIIGQHTLCLIEEVNHSAFTRFPSPLRTYVRHESYLA